MRIGVDKLEQTIQAELDSYSREVGWQVDEAAVKVAKKALRRLKQTSPDRTGAYRKGWALRQERERSRTLATIYNKTRYMLIHLLEHGHQKASGGRVEGQPHWGPAVEQAEQEFVSEVTQRLGG